MFSDIEIGVFLDELEEKLQIINDNLLVLEREPENQEVLQEIFRAAHTIKGSSGVMGYEKMASLTHEIENLFDKIRQGQVTVDSEMINILFEASDALRMLKDEITGDGVTVDVSEVVAKVSGCLGGHCDTPKPESQAPEAPVPADGEYRHSWVPLDDVVESVIREAELKGYWAFQVALVLDESCQMKNVRAFLIFETLQQMGEIIRSVPAAEDLQEGRFDRAFEVILLTREDQGQIYNTLMSIAEVHMVELKLIAALQTAEGQKEAGPAPSGQEGKAETAEEKTAPTKERGSARVVKTVRVDVQKLDTLMNLVGELVIDRTRLSRFAEIFESQYRSDELAESINEIANHLGQVTSDLQEQIMKARMLPVSQIFNRFPRMVRDTAQKLGKEIDFIVEGKETELDRNVIEMIGDPLIHLIRNAIDHGIETPEERIRKGKPRAGRLELKASYHESHIVITIEDDGKGIDVNKIRQRAVDLGLYDREGAARLSDREVLDLIFRPGFSTASSVSDLSGRGVGMDVVRTAIEQINGMVDLDTKLGEGSKFTISLPLTLAIIRSLMVSLDDQVYAFPLSNVQETLRINADEIRRIGNNEVIVVRERILPLLRLSEFFGMGSSEADKLYVVIVASAERRVAVVVDRLLGEQEIVIKSLGEYLGDVVGLSGATILGDGQVALIVDARGIVKEAGIVEDVQYAG
ncbi:chemotaxis protein CheA [Desulfofalx alkaliphila]|uniref:chemotaxis protein CheA n=1 Tax=Desulfofalx alkaliphila TaxID=105483 RepID=UPI0004E1C91E|nr:chemotaxis protein CheA [Desulfofalx alkaliphila]